MKNNDDFYGFAGFVAMINDEGKNKNGGCAVSILKIIVFIVIFLLILKSCG